jgi:hypothetical protein
MSIDTCRTTALSALVIDRQCCCSAQYMLSIVLEAVHSTKTQRQHCSFKPDRPIQYPQSQNPTALAASPTRRTTIKSP